MALRAPLLAQVSAALLLACDDGYHDAPDGTKQAVLGARRHKGKDGACTLRFDGSNGAFRPVVAPFNANHRHKKYTAFTPVHCAVRVALAAAREGDLPVMVIPPSLLFSGQPLVQHFLHEQYMRFKRLEPVRTR
jgi:hypothetical protein